MATLVGGIIALILGLIGLVYWGDEFVILLKGAIPVILVLGGALAAYLGVEEWKDTHTAEDTGFSGESSADTEKYKAEAEKYKAELEALKKEEEKDISEEERSEA